MQARGRDVGGKKPSSSAGRAGRAAATSGCPSGRHVVEEGEQRRRGLSRLLPSPHRAPARGGCLLACRRGSGRRNRKGRRSGFGSRRFGWRALGRGLRLRMPRVGAHAVGPERAGHRRAAADLVLLAAAAIDAAPTHRLQQRLAAMAEGAQLVGGQCPRVLADDGAVGGGFETVGRFTPPGRGSARAGRSAAAAAGGSYARLARANPTGAGLAHAARPASGWLRPPCCRPAP